MKPMKILTIAAILCMPLQVAAADFSDPTWPCIQRKVESLSLGLMWPYATEPAPSDDALRRDAEELADTLVLRRVALEDLEQDVAAFAERYDGDPLALGLVFSRTFDTLSDRRTRIIAGIGDFSLGQIAMAERVDAKRLEMSQILSSAEPDFDRVDVLEEEIDWDQVIYTDRQRSITYLCETPQLIEKRLFAIARMLQAAVAD